MTLPEFVADLKKQRDTMERWFESSTRSQMPNDPLGWQIPILDDVIRRLEEEVLPQYRDTPRDPSHTWYDVTRGTYIPPPDGEGPGIYTVHEPPATDYSDWPETLIPDDVLAKMKGETPEPPHFEEPPSGWRDRDPLL